MPAGGRRSRAGRRRRGLAVCGFAALSGRDAGRRPALQPFPRFTGGWLYVVRTPVGCGADRRSAFPGGPRALRGGGCTSFAPLRGAVPVGGRRSLAVPAFFGGVAVRRSHPCGVRCRPEVGVPWLGVVGTGWLFVVSRPSRAAMPVGDRRSSRSRASRGGGCTSFAPLWGAGAGLRSAFPGWASSARVGCLWFRGPLGPRCRSETGAPAVPALYGGWLYVVRTPAGWGADRRSVFPCWASSARVGCLWFRGPLGPRCRSETGAPAAVPCGPVVVRGFAALRAAMPVGDRRSDGARFAQVGDVRSRGLCAGRRCAVSAVAPC